MALSTGSGLRPLPGTPGAAGWEVLPAAQTPAAPSGGAPLVPQHPRTTKSVANVILAILGGVTQYVSPFIADDSNTARNLDHITVQGAKDRARYAFDASRASLQDDRTLGLTRVPTRCQHATVALMGTLFHHRSVSVRAEVGRMFWEIAGAHRICPEINYRVPEFATLAGGDWVHRVPLALAAPGVGLYNPIACPRAANSSYRPPQATLSCCAPPSCGTATQDA